MDALDRDALLQIALGDDHLDDLTPTRHEIAEQLGRFVGERTQYGLVASTKRATMRAWIGSVFARCLSAWAKWRTCAD